MKKQVKIAVLLFFSSLPCFSQQTSPYLDSLFKTGLPQFTKVFANPGKYGLQVIYTQITRDKDNIPSFKNYYWGADSTVYFYPASLVKLPVSIVALEKLYDLKDKGIDRNTPMLTDSVFFCQKKVLSDTSAENKLPSVANYIKKMFLVSDNFSFARVYEFVGCDYLHAELERLGFPNIRIVNRLDAQCKGDTAKITPPVAFVSPDGDVLYKQDLAFPAYNKEYPLSNARIGRAHVNDAGKRVYEPKDFSRHNLLSLYNCHELLKCLVFWNYEPEKTKYRIDTNDWRFAMRYLGMYPRESDFPSYNPRIFYDSFKKYFLYGAAVPLLDQDSLRIFNIVGRAYGFLSDVAYVVDYKNKIEFLLSATIYVSERNIVGSGRYEYDQLGLPLFRHISLLLYGEEKRRTRKYEPDLSEFDLFRK